ncbi:MAG: hypothetical protein ACRCU3_09025 [Eubacteriaceae bacterium]
MIKKKIKSEKRKECEICHKNPGVTTMRGLTGKKILVCMSCKKRVQC